MCLRLKALRAVVAQRIVIYIIFIGFVLVIGRCKCACLHVTIIDRFEQLHDMGAMIIQLHDQLLGVICTKLQVHVFQHVMF